LKLRMLPKLEGWTFILQIGPHVISLFKKAENIIANFKQNFVLILRRVQYLALFITLDDD
jgi:hypothetical protein